MKGNHARRAVAAEADAEKAGGRRRGVGEGAEAGLGGGFAGDAREDHVGQAEVGMIQEIEELDVEAELTAFRQRKPFRKVEIAPDEIGAAERVAAEAAKLAVDGRVAADACARAGIDGGDERVGIEPLQRAGLRDTWNRMAIVERHASDEAGELRAAAVDDAVAVGRVGSAQHRERHAAVEEYGAGNLPAINRTSKNRIANFPGKLVHIVGREVVSNVVIARAVVARQIAGKRRENSAGGKFEEAAVGDGVHAAAEGVVHLSGEAVAEALLRGDLEAVVVAVRAGRELGDGAESWIGGLREGERYETAFADGLVAVHLREIRLIHGARADVLHVDAARGSELVFDAEAPLQEVGRVKFAGGHRGDRDWRKAARGIRLSLRRGAG